MESSLFWTRRFAEYYIGAGTRQAVDKHRAMTQEAKQPLRGQIVGGACVALSVKHMAYFGGEGAS